MENEGHLSQPMYEHSQSSTSTISSPGLDLSRIPPIAILSAHLQDEDGRRLEQTLRKHHAPLVTDAARASVFIGKVGTKRRAEFELRSRKLVVEEVIALKRLASPIKATNSPNKRQKVAREKSRLVSPGEGDSTTEDEATEVSETEDEAPDELQGIPISLPSRAGDTGVAPIFDKSTQDDIVWVVKMDWLEACVSTNHLVPLADSLVYKAKVLERPEQLKSKSKSIRDLFAPTTKEKPPSQTVLASRPQTVQEILDRAQSDASATKPKTKYQPHQFGKSHGSRRFEGKSYATSSKSHTAHLLKKTTSEYESEDSDLPQPPDWVRKGVKYACERFTPANGANEDFIDQLRKIRTARTLIDDQIGVRAYSTIIASIAAYPHKLSHPRELAQLPGCDEKTVALFVEWKNTGKIHAVIEYENDEAMKVLRSFYDVWGVGAKTARHFYYDRNWTELDDIIEFGWNDLDRVQQIGLKYYDEFLVGIPRAEVEQIASVVKDCAIKLRDERITITIVGGYRRGKLESGDVDMIVSHPDLESTAGLVREIVEALEDAEWITHTLTLSLTNTHRGQHTLPFRSARGTGVGFDTLDKALVVWQDPNWASREQDLAKNEDTKNPNIHRRVDIIVAPWRTVGCAVMGWSGGTTFQRDLRRYAKYTKGWKFDSSGIRSRSNGEVIAVEGPDGVVGTPEDAERAVFKGLGLEYVPPEYRVTF